MRALFMILAMLGSGCARLHTVEDCELLIHVVNPELSAIAELNHAGKHPAGFYGKIADRYDKLAGRVAKVAVRSQQLAVGQQQFKEVLELVARHARDFDAGLGEKRDKQRELNLRRARKGMSSAARQYVAAVKRLDAICHPR